MLDIYGHKKSELLKEIEDLRKELAYLRKEFEEFRNNPPNPSILFYSDCKVLPLFHLPLVPNIPHPF